MSLVINGTTTALLYEEEVYNKEDRPVISPGQNPFKMMLFRFLMSKLSLEMESIRKIGPKKVLFIILVSLLIIETTTGLPDEGGIYSKDDIPVIVFSSKYI